MRRLSFSVQTLLAAAVVGLLWHTLQAAEHARVRAEVHGRLAAARGERIVALEGELADALHARDGVREFIRERIATEAAAREAQEQRLRAATQPLPDGLRLAIETLHDLWRRGGHHRLRVLSLRAIEAKELRGLELFEAPDELGTGTTLWQAERASVRLDRGAETLTLWLHDGYVVRGGSRVALAAAGEPLVLAGVDGKAYEERLPYLVVAAGAYPQPEPAVPVAARLDPFTARRWQERLNQLLAGATTPMRYRVGELEGLAEGEFLRVVLFGAAGKRIEQMAEVDRLAVVLDEGAGTVELELIGGVFRRAGGDTALPAAPPGQRILLSGVTPQTASDTMTGMVVRR